MTTHHTQHREKGFGLVEVLLSLALMAALLTAVAFAMQASFQSYNANDEAAALTQTARFTMLQMTRDMRTAEDISAVGTTKLVIVPAANGNGLQEVQYELTGGVLYYRQKVNGVTTSYVLLGSDDRVKVSGFAVTLLSGTDWQSTACTKTAQVKLDLQIRGQTLSLTASGSPRRNQLY